MSKNLKVLLISPFPIQEGRVVGGVEAVASVLAPALAAREEISQVTVLSFYYKASRALTPLVVSDKWIGDKCHVLYKHGQERLSLPTHSILEFMQARRVVQDLRPDIIHGQGLAGGGELAVRLSDRAIVTIHGLVHLEARMRSKGTLPDRLRVGLFDSIVRRVLRRSCIAISTSKYDAFALKDLFCGKHMTINNPVASEFFTKSEEPESNTILFAGMLVRRKNMEGLLHALVNVRQHIPEARLVIVGPIPDPLYQGEIFEMIKTLHLEDAVTFRGLIENRELVDELAKSSCVVLFSHEETSPTIIAQAMAAGRPVVASSVGGIPELVLDGLNGFLVSPKDERTLADRLIALLESPGLCKQMGLHGREIALERFEPNSVARQTVAAYQLALES